MTDDEKLVRRIDEHGDGLTPWETDFVADMVRRVVEQKQTLTDKQRVICTRIDEQRVR